MPFYNFSGMLSATQRRRKWILENNLRLPKLSQDFLVKMTLTRATRERSRAVRVKTTVSLFGMLRGVNSLWIIFRTLRACATGRIEQASKIQ